MRTPHKLASKSPEDRAKYARDARLGSLDFHADLVESMAWAFTATTEDERSAWTDRVERLLTSTQEHADAPAATAALASASARPGGI